MLASPPARASEPWIDSLGAIAIQDGGRVMPLDTYARRLAVQLTGRQHWSKDRGPEAFAGREPMQLLCDLMFKGRDVLQQQLIAIENKPFKRAMDLDPERRFFSAAEVSSCKGINGLLAAFSAARESNHDVQATKDQRRALDLAAAANRIAALVTGEPLAIVPAGPDRAFLRVGVDGGDPGTEKVREAFGAFAKAYAAGAPLESPATQLRAAIDATGRLEPAAAKAVGLELFYNRHDPWRQTEILYALAIVLFGVSRLVLRRPLMILAIVAAVAGVAEHILGIGLRVAILGRAPVSNTYESLLWMGLIAMAIGFVAQLMNRKGYYLFGGLVAAFISVIFAAMVPLEDRTNSLPAVLRSNYWLTLHVLTVVASYGVFTVASVLGHVYLAREVFMRRRGEPAVEAARLSHPLVVQIYRTIQVGLFLLTAGTILGGVWAADSWGRFWGWDPKETWALISIVTYFAVLHARYLHWLEDFGLAASAVLGFVVIVWTFYGVNYVMASGLHSYGFGSGGEIWVALWAAAELVFLVVCWAKRVGMRRPAAPPQPRPEHSPA